MRFLTVKRKIHFLFLCLFASMTGLATQIEVSSSADSGVNTLRDAISGALSGDTIVFSPAINTDTIFLTGAEIIIDVDLVILGNDTSNTIIDGGGNSRIFNIQPNDTVTISRCHLRNGQSSEGGAIINKGHLTIYHCKISNNITTADGAAIVSDNYLEIHHSLISANNAQPILEHGYGGALFNDGGSLVISNSILMDNHATNTGSENYRGGAIASLFGSIKLTDVEMFGNSITTYSGYCFGGALYIIASEAELLRLNVHHNTVFAEFGHVFGAGIYFDSSIPSTISDSRIANNAASSKNFAIGGGISIDGFSDLSLQGVSIFNNTCAANYAYGGGLYNVASSIELKMVEIKANSVTSIPSSTIPISLARGGGLYNHSSVVVISNSAISNNVLNGANSVGGGIYALLGSTELINSTITGNKAREGGGTSIKTFDTSGPVTLLTMRNSIIAKNVANLYPDIYNDYGMIAGIEYSLIGDTTGIFHTMNPADSNLIGDAAQPLDPLFFECTDTLGLPNFSGNHRLMPSSPAVNAGSNANLSPLDTLDLDGNPRFVQTIVDMGAYEYSQSLNLIVTTTANSGYGSLRAAVSAAFAGDTIRFSPSIDMDTIVLSGEQIVLDSNLVIIGNGAENTIIDGDSTDRIFTIDTNISVQIFGVTVQNGGQVLEGGGILNAGFLEMTSCHIVHNSIEDYSFSFSGLGGGLYSSGGTLNLTNCILAHNTITTFAAALGGGLFSTNSQVDIQQSRIESNSTTAPGEANGAGLSIEQGSLTLTNSTIRDCSSNSTNSLAYAGALMAIGAQVTLLHDTIQQNRVNAFTRAQGGGVCLYFGQGELRHCLIDGNEALSSFFRAEGGGLFIENGNFDLFNNRCAGNLARALMNDAIGGGIYCNQGTINIKNNTISGNRAAGQVNDLGGGLYNGGANVELVNTIVAKNRALDGPDVKCFFAIDDAGFNLIGDTTSSLNSFINSTLLGNTSHPFNPSFVECVDTTSLPNLTGNLRFASCSEAVNGGIQDSLGVADTIDLDQHARIYGYQVDIGCFEYRGSADDALVTNTNDNGCGSLRFAAYFTPACDTVRFVDSINMDTIFLHNGEIKIDKKMTILGNGTLNTIVDADSTSRIFRICTPDSVRILHTTLQNGGRVEQGGAIFNESHLLVSHCQLINNSCTGDDNIRGGAILSQDGSLCIMHSRLANNKIKANLFSALGGAIYHEKGGIKIMRNQIIDNSAQSNGSCFGGGLYISEGTGEITSNKISGNAVDAASDAYGGGLYNVLAGLNITNNLFSGNLVSADVFAVGGGLNNNFGKINLMNNTVTGNKVISNFDAISGGVHSESDTIKCANNIIAKNIATQGPDVGGFGAYLDLGNNLIGDTTGTISLFTNSVLKGGPGNEVDPQFISSVDTTTLPNSDGNLRLQYGAQAIDAGDTTGLLVYIESLDLDSMARVQAANIDIGCFEFSLDFPCGYYMTLQVDDSPIVSAIYRATVAVQSAGLVNPASGGAVEFKSEQSIDLEAGFEVEVGQEFSAEIEDPCVD